MMQQIVRDPIYKQLNQALRKLIFSDYTGGDRFLSEREVGERFEVSRATANKALSSLVAEDILQFRKGVGSFVKESALDYDLRALVSFTGKALAAGKAPSTRVLSAECRRAGSLPPVALVALCLEKDNAVFCLERLRLADGEPMILERRTVVAKHSPDLLKKDLTGSLYALWTDEYGLEISGAGQSIRAVNICKEDAALLTVKSGLAGLMVRSVGYLRGEQPLWWEETLYRGDLYEFNNYLGPMRSSRPATSGFIDSEQGVTYAQD